MKERKKILKDSPRIALPWDIIMIQISFYTMEFYDDVIDYWGIFCEDTYAS